MKRGELVCEGDFMLKASHRHIIHLRPPYYQFCFPASLYVSTKPPALQHSNTYPPLQASYRQYIEPVQVEVAKAIEAERVSGGQQREVRID